MHQTRARTRLNTANLPGLTAATTRRGDTSRTKATTATPSPRVARGAANKAKSSVAKPGAEAESKLHAAHEEFVAHSEDESDDEVDVLIDADGASSLKTPESFADDCV